MKYLSVFSVLAAMLISFVLAAQAGIDPTLLLYLDFNEGNGDELRDLSGHGHNAVIHGKSPVWDVGKFGSAIDFNGEDNYGEIERTDDLTFGEDTEFSVMAWIKTEFEPPENVGILTNYKEQTTPFWNICVRQLSPGPGFARFQFRDVDGNIVTTTSAKPLNDGSWHHIAGVRDVDADVARLYIDGVLAEEKKDTSSGDINSGQNIWIGIIYDFCFDGLIDEIKLWNRPLTAAEVETEMNRADLVVGVVGKLVATWGMIKLSD